MEHYDLTIIGTGSGNSVLDHRYDGLKVAICEQGMFGGTCLNVGCIPTKMFVYAADVAQTVRHSATYGVDAHIDGVRWPDIVAGLTRSRPVGRSTAVACRTSRSTPVTPASARHCPTAPIRYGPPTETNSRPTAW